MIFLVVAVLFMIGATTWLAQQRPVAGHAELHRRLTDMGLVLCLAAVAAALLAGLVFAL